MQLGMQLVIGREKLAPLHGLIPATEVCDKTARFFHKQQASRDIPALEIAFPKTIITACSNPSEIKRC